MECLYIEEIERTIAFDVGLHIAIRRETSHEHMPARRIKRNGFISFHNLESVEAPRKPGDIRGQADRSLKPNSA